MASFLVRNALILAALVLLPLFLGEFWAYQLGLYFLYGLAALGIGLTWGQVGILPLGQGMFVAIAAYLTAYGLFGFGTSPMAYLVLPAASVVVAVFGFAFAALVFRGRFEQGPSFSLMTLALTLAAFQIANGWSSVTGGFNGLRNIPGLPGLDGFLDLYHLIAVVLALSIAGVDYLVRAPIGVLWRAIADNERRLAFLGYDVALLKAAGFAVACGLAGLAGALYAPQQNLVTPDLAGFAFSGDLVIFAAVGGRATVLGPVIGALVVGVLSAELRDRFPWWEIVIALFFILVVLRLPGGLMTLFAPLRRLSLGRNAVPVPLEAPSKPRTASPLSVAFEDVRVRVGDVTILDGLSVRTGEEAVLCVIGPNGAGKTSALNVMTGVLPKRGGRIVIDGLDVLRPEPATVAGKGVARKFQTPSVFPKLTIDENLAVALWAGRWRLFDLLRPSLFGWTSPLLEEMRGRFQFLEQGGKLASALSHGERQLLELTMALITEPRLLLLDEPCAGLSHEETSAVIEAIQWARQYLNLRIIIIEHDMELVRRLADRVVVLHQGRFLADGSIEEVQHNPEVQAVYVGGSR
ncbi:ATP-binding cassette domain-containing protein [Bradyrhizobium sp. Ce-3]|uniref:branched-chain amino acid ABC transporter ATP-binding protein/permease n=1 Tax=Bradyrhizobium sp. Ce-3 TaxID=2913970 RepID=UPI001FC7E23C|nr:ATP-binding cassette domain-containing protein [Bradyrhizobium sp. Ce-3]GKQ55133.1 ABC transporter ATP-binding protein [Bradyrhizobium sp. Ce-3]